MTFLWDFILKLDSRGTLRDSHWMDVPEDEIVNDAGQRSSLTPGEIVEALDNSVLNIAFAERGVKEHGEE